VIRGYDEKNDKPGDIILMLSKEATHICPTYKSWYTFDDAIRVELPRSSTPGHYSVFIGYFTSGVAVSYTEMYYAKQGVSPSADVWYIDNITRVWKKRDYSHVGIDADIVLYN